MKISFVLQTNKSVFFKKNIQDRREFSKSSPCFGDTFKKNKEKESDHIDKLMKIQNENYNRVISEMESTDYKKKNVDEELSIRTNYLARLNNIKNEYEKINNLLSQSKGNDKAQNAEIIVKFMEARNKIAKDKGFNRISGYSDIINKLKEAFSINIILKNKLYGFEETTKVPDILFFYGPTGTGKTTFAKALAEDSISNIIDLNLATASNDEQRLALLKNALDKALENYVKVSNPQDRHRTIILINEADSLIKKANPKLPNYEKQKKTVNTFLSLIDNCSEKYKATIFLTTNNPLRIDDKILNRNVTPIKVGLGPCSKNEAKLILEKQLKLYDIDINTENIIEKLFCNPNKVYSNSNIVTLIEQMALAQAKTEKEFLMALENGFIQPSIQPRDIEIFKQANEIFKTNKNNEKN